MIDDGSVLLLRKGILRNYFVEIKNSVDEFTSFLVILGGISARALDLFRQNLEGRTIQSIRYSLFFKFLIIMHIANLDVTHFF